LKCCDNDCFTGSVGAGMPSLHDPGSTFLSLHRRSESVDHTHVIFPRPLRLPYASPCGRAFVLNEYTSYMDERYAKVARRGLTDSCQLRRWQASEGWRTTGRGSCQAMRVRPTPRARGAASRHACLKVAYCRATNRPKRFAG